MQKMLAATLVLGVLSSFPLGGVFAQERASSQVFGRDLTSANSSPILQSAAVKELARIVQAKAVQSQSGASQQSWPARHPVWMGTLIGGVGGAATGCLIGAQAENPDVTCGFYTGFFMFAGAGIGALTGWVWSLSK